MILPTASPRIHAIESLVKEFTPLESTEKQQAEKRLSSLDLGTVKPKNIDEKNKAILPAEYLDLAVQTHLAEKAEKSAEELRYYIQLHQETCSDLRRVLHPMASIFSFIAKVHPVKLARTQAKIEVENIPRIIEAFRTRSGFIPKQVEVFPKYRSLDAILDAKESSEGFRLGKMVVPKEDYAHLKELCKEWEQNDSATCHAKLIALRHAPRDVQIRFVDAATPSILSDKLTASRAQMRIRWNPFERREIGRIHALLQIKKNQAAANHFGEVHVTPMVVFAHEMQHVIEMLYAPQAFTILAKMPTFPSLTNLEEARVILGYENALVEKSGFKPRTSHQGMVPVTLENHNSGEAVMPYRKLLTGKVNYLHSGKSISGNILSVDKEHIILQTLQGKIEIPTEAIMAHDFDARLGDSEVLQESLNMLKECAGHNQPISIAYKEKYGTAIADIKIEKEPVGLATLLPSRKIQSIDEFLESFRQEDRALETTEKILEGFSNTHNLSGE